MSWICFTWTNFEFLRLIFVLAPPALIVPYLLQILNHDTKIASGKQNIYLRSTSIYNFVFVTKSVVHPRIQFFISCWVKFFYLAPSIAYIRFSIITIFLSNHTIFLDNVVTQGAKLHMNNQSMISRQADPLKRGGSPESRMTKEQIIQEGYKFFTMLVIIYVKRILSHYCIDLPFLLHIICHVCPFWFAPNK